MMFIQLKDFTFSYDKRTSVLSDVNFTVQKGEKVGLLGINGSGKTTLLNCVFGELETTDNIFVLGENPFLKKENIRKRIGFITDTVDVIDYLTFKELMVFLTDIYGKENIDANRLEYLLDLFNLKDVYSHQLIKNYSFGMKKKLQLITLLVVSYQYYIVDEPTNGLDIVSIYHLKNIFKTMTDLTYIISSHEISFIKETCDKVVFIKNGKVSPKMDITNLSADSVEKMFMEFYYE